MQSRSTGIGSKLENAPNPLGSSSDLCSLINQTSNIKDMQRSNADRLMTLVNRLYCQPAMPVPAETKTQPTSGLIADLQALINDVREEEEAISALITQLEQL